MGELSNEVIRSIDERVRITELPGGIRVVSDPVPQAASVAIGAWVGVGSRDEPSELAGASHFMEHLLFKGTDRRSCAEVSTAIDAVGGELNAFTTKEHTAFYTRVPGGDTDLGLDLLAEILTVPAMEERHVEIEREVILEELAMVTDTPDELVFSVLNEELFPGHPLGWEVLGRQDTLEALAREDLSGFFGQWYGPPHIVVAAAGAVDHDWLVGQATERFGDRPIPDRHDRRAPESLVGSVTAVDRDSEQVHLALGWRGVHHLDPDRYALAVLNHVLGDGPSSRLFREIRDERGLAYSVFTSHSSSSDAGSVSLYCGTAPEHLEEVRALVGAELARIRTEPVASDELEVAIGYLCGSMILGLEDHGARMSRLAASMSALGELVPVADVIGRIRAVTTEDIMALADRIFGSPAVEVTVGPT